MIKKSTTAGFISWDFALKHIKNNSIKKIFFIMNMFIKISKILLVFFCYLFASGYMLYAHEFWIEPLKYINENNEIKAHLRVGQNFEGMTFPVQK